MDEVTVYSKGDIRSCGAQPCEYRVMFNGRVWIHLSNNHAVSVFVPHLAWPYPEHKHRLRLVNADDWRYHFECRICTFKFSYTWIAVRNMMSGRYV